MCSSLSAVFTAVCLRNDLPSWQRADLILLNATDDIPYLDMAVLRKQFETVESLELPSLKEAMEQSEAQQTDALPETEDDAPETMPAAADVEEPSDEEASADMEDEKTADTPVDDSTDSDLGIDDLGSDAGDNDAGDNIGDDENSNDESASNARKNAFWLEACERETESTAIWNHCGALYFHAVNSCTLFLIYSTLSNNRELQLHMFDDGTGRVGTVGNVQKQLQRSGKSCFGKAASVRIANALQDVCVYDRKQLQRGKSKSSVGPTLIGGLNNHAEDCASVFNVNEFPVFSLLQVAGENKVSDKQSFQLMKMISTQLKKQD